MCSLPFEYCEWGPQFPKCKEWFQGNFQRFYPEVGTADLAHEDVVALMKRLGFEGEPDAAAAAPGSTQCAHRLHCRASSAYHRLQRALGRAVPNPARG